MNKRELSKQVDKAAAKATTELREMLQDVSRQIIDDQRKWLDDSMKDLLPPALYDAGRRGEMQEEIESYMKRHEIKIVFIPDSYSIRILVGDSVHSQFITKLEVDGEPIDMNPTGPINN